MITKYLLVLGCDLAGDGNRLGPRTVRRLQGAVRYAIEHDYVVCVSATISPNFPKQRIPMYEQMESLVKINSDVDVLSMVGPGDFNTRGELAKFVGYFKIETDYELAVASSWWNIPRVRMIFADMFPDCSKEVKFIRLHDEVTKKLLLLEALKFCFAKLPEVWRKQIAKLFLIIGFNSSG